MLFSKIDTECLTAKYVNWTLKNNMNSRPKANPNILSYCYFCLQKLIFDDTLPLSHISRIYKSIYVKRLSKYTWLRFGFWHTDLFIVKNKKKRAESLLKITICIIRFDILTNTLFSFETDMEVFFWQILSLRILTYQRGSDYKVNMKKRL